MWQLSSLAGKVALVTGASRGIGQMVANVLGQMEATVIGTATTAQGAEKIDEFLKAQGLQGQGMVLDVCVQETIDQTLRTIEKTKGLPTILVNNAGITQDNLLLRMQEAQWQSVLQTNLTGTYRLSKACLKGMLKARWGRIISIGSVVGQMGNPGQANYAAAKAGMVAFSKSLAKEVGARGVTVNVVAPGFIETDMTHALAKAQQEALLSHIPLGALGQPMDVAACVGFLASEQARYISGETLHVNGGMYMS